MREKRKNSADILLLAALTLCGLVLALVLVLSGQAGAFVEVRVSGEVVERFSLDEPVRYEITGADGGTNLLVIENGRACITRADCPDGLCCNMGSIHTVGQSIVCLPHEIVVEVTGEGETEAQIDLVVG